MDISKDSNYSTLLEDVDGPSTGNVNLDDHIESGDETQVDSQDEICSPQKGFLRLYKTYINSYILQADTASSLKYYRPYSKANIEFRMSRCIDHPDMK